MTTQESDKENKSELSSEIGNPAGRGGSDSEMAATILYLAGPGGLFCNGEVIHPDVSLVYFVMCIMATNHLQGGSTLTSPSVM